VNIDGSASVTLGASAQQNNAINLRSLTTFETQDAPHKADRLQIRGRGLIGETFFGKRSPGLFGDITDSIKGAASSVGGAIGNAASAVKDAVTGKDDSGAGNDASSTAATATSTADAAAPNTDNSDNSNNGNGASFGGCLDANAGLSVNVGADAAFFSFFDPSTSFSLFSKTFPLSHVRILPSFEPYLY